MSLLEDPIFKNRYKKYKLRVKLWESDFMESNGRKPTKTDIKQADIKIREAYKLYWNLKTTVLEDSLTDITFTEDTSQSSNSVLKESSNISNINDTLNSISSDLINSTINSTVNDNFNDTVNDKFNDTVNDSLSNSVCESVLKLNVEDPVNEKETKDENTIQNVKGVWGEQFNMKKVDKSSNKRILVGKTSFQLSQKMFKSSSFIKRNPRKSLSSNKISKLKSFKKDEKTNNDDKKLSIKETDESIEKSNATLGDTDETNVSIPENDISDEFLEMLDNSIKINTQANNKVASQTIGGIQQIIQQSKNVRVIDPGWAKRCTMDIKDIVPPQNTQKTQSQKTDTHISDEEDFVYNSDSEEERRKKRIRNMRKHFSDSVFHKTKRICTELNAIRHKSDTFSLPVKESEEQIPKPIFKSPTEEIVDNTHKEITKFNDKIMLEEKSKVAPEPSDESTDDEQVKRKTVGRKRVASKAGKPSTRSRKSVTAAKSLPTRRSLRISKTDSVYDFEEPTEEEQIKTNEKQSKHDDLDAFNVENVNTVARINMNPEHSGNLVYDFSKVLDTISHEEPSSAQPKKKAKSQMTDKEKLEAKIADGTLNDNFVRINLKKKVFSRGYKQFNYSKYKKAEWKKHKKNAAASSAALDALDYAEKHGNTCFKCKEPGHWSRNCPNSKGDSLMSIEDSEEVVIPSEFPTLQEAAQMARSSTEIRFSKMAARNAGDDAEENYEDWDDWEDADDEPVVPSQNIKEVCKVPEELIEKLLPPEKNAVAPLYDIQQDLSVIDTPPEVYKTLKKFGHDSFRQGQEKAIMRILSGQSTLVTLATGTGKSLCYQLPAFMYAQKYKCITLVISPLVSLMDDQVKGFSPIIRGACLHTSQTEKVRKQVIESIKDGKIDVLLVSPEAIVAGEKSTGFGAVIRHLPPIAFACIDEAHCISQWSHNFRPSYLMLCRVLKEKMKVKVILGLTATATKTNALNIVEHLDIPDGLEGVVTDRPLPDNLQLTVSCDADRDRALIKLLESPRLRDCQSILIYCTRREECVRIAGYLRTVLADSIKHLQNVKKNLSPIAEAYHAGFAAGRRRTVQQAFMRGDIRIIVATVAFGMGINKSDIRCVIHYNMPSNFENYVQEIGRAGRDGLPAQCHLFLNANANNDKIELRRHIFANGVDRSAVRKLLKLLFIPCSCQSNLQKDCGQRCSGHEVAIPIDQTVQDLDISEEIITTLLCYLELHPKNFVTVLPSAYVRARVSTYGGVRALKLAAQQSPPLAMAIALGLKNETYKESEGIIEFNVIDIASNIGWDSGIVKSHLKGLEWITHNGVTKRSQLSVRFDKLGLRVRAPGDLTDDELDEALDALYHRCKIQETTRLAQLNSICDIVRNYSVKTVGECSELNEELIKKSELFKEEIRKYFVGDDIPAQIENQEKTKPSNESKIISDIRGLISIYKESPFTGRAIARIFYGIQSPNFPANVWFRCKYWRAHLDVDFNYLSYLATQELIVR